MQSFDCDDYRPSWCKLHQQGKLLQRAQAGRAQGHGQQGPPAISPARPACGKRASRQCRRPRRAGCPTLLHCCPPPPLPAPPAGGPGQACPARHSTAEEMGASVERWAPQRICSDVGCRQLQPLDNIYERHTATVTDCPQNARTQAHLCLLGQRAFARDAVDHPALRLRWGAVRSAPMCISGCANRTVCCVLLCARRRQRARLQSSIMQLSSAAAASFLLAPLLGPQLAVHASRHSPFGESRLQQPPASAYKDHQRPTTLQCLTWQPQ